MEQVVALLFFLLLFLLALPIWAIVAALRARRAAEENQKSLRTLEQRFEALTRRLRSTETEPEKPITAPPAAAPSERSAPPPVTPGPPLRPASGGVPAPPGPLPPPVPSTPSIPVLPPPRPVSPPFDWENLISVRLFAWLGGAALFLAAALFLQYSIQHGLISPAARVAIGLLVGAVALVGGDSVRARAQWAGQATSGAGVAILYASLFAAHARYELLSTPATFAGMILVTVTAGLLAVKRDAFLLAVLGLLGGFLTPYLLSTHEDHPIALFGYVLLLDLGVLAVARQKAWPGIRLLALVASAVLYAGWAATFLDGVKVPYAMAAAAVLASLFAFPRPGAAEEEETQKRDLARAIPLLALAGPLLLTLVVSSRTALAVSPAFLVGYLLILGAGGALVSQRLDFAPVVPIAAGFSVLALTLRVDAHLFPERRVETLALFGLVSAAYFCFWLFRRESFSAPVLRTAAAIALAGSLPIIFQVAAVEPQREPIAALWIFAFAHSLGLLWIGASLLSGGWILGAQVVLYIALLCLCGRFQNPRLHEFLAPILIPTLLFWSLPFLGDRFRADRLSWLSAAVAPLIHYPILYVLAKPTWTAAPLGAAAVVFAAASLVALRRAAKIVGDEKERRYAMALFGAVTLAFITAAIPILLDKEWITVAWALEAASLAWLATRIPEDGLVKAAAALSAAAFFRLVANPELWGYHARSGTPVLNWYLYTFGIPAAAFIASARWTKGNAWARTVRLPEILSAAAGVILFVLINVEIADFYSTGVGLTFRLKGGGLAEDMTYSLAWGVFAVGLLLLGLARRSKPTRAAALGVLVLTIGKVFLHDLWDLGALYRVGSIVGLALALLAVSFLTQRFVLAKEES